MFKLNNNDKVLDQNSKGIAHYFKLKDLFIQRKAITSNLEIFAIAQARWVPALQNDINMVYAEIWEFKEGKQKGQQILKDHLDAYINKQKVDWLELFDRMRHTDSEEISKIDLCNELIRVELPPFETLSMVRKSDNSTLLIEALKSKHGDFETTWAEWWTYKLGKKQDTRVLKSYLFLNDVNGDTFDINSLYKST